ncbi:MAG: hypothetical protein KH403_01420 [Bacteroides caccae]|nr:hypothetical protein [Bacteroides caccae]
MAHRLNTNKQFMVGNGILAFAVIFVVVIFIYMSMRLQQKQQEERHFIETYTIIVDNKTELVSTFDLSERGGNYQFEKEEDGIKQLAK